MRYIYRLLLAVALVALPAIAQAQQTPPAQRDNVKRGQMQGGMRGQMRGEMQGRMRAQMRNQPRKHSFTQALLVQKTELGLSAEQVTQLERIGADFEAKNGPLQEQMREKMAGVSEGMREKMTQLRGAGGDVAELSTEERAALRTEMRQERDQIQAELRQQMAPLMEEIRANHDAAREQAQQLLTAEQQEKAKELVQARRQEQRKQLQEQREEWQKNRQEKQPGERPARRERQRPTGDQNSTGGQPHSSGESSH